MVLIMDKVDVYEASENISALLRTLQPTDEEYKQLVKQAIDITDSIKNIMQSNDELHFKFIYDLEFLIKSLDIICNNYFWAPWLTSSGLDNQKTILFKVNLFKLNQIIDKYKRTHVNQHTTAIHLNEIIRNLRQIIKNKKDE